MTYLVIGALVLLALAAVAYPLFRKPAIEPGKADDATLEQMIANYRSALSAGSVCSRCLRDNPTNSKFCGECGLKLQAINSR